MDRDRDTGQYLSCHRERRRKLASARASHQLNKSNQGMGNDPSEPKPFAQSSRMVSDFTLTRQRENIAGLEVGWCGTDLRSGLELQASQTKVRATRGAAGRRIRPRCRATTRADHLRRPSNRAERRGRHALTENRLVPVNSLSVARRGSPTVRPPETSQPEDARIVVPAPCPRRHARRPRRRASPSFQMRSNGGATAESTLRLFERLAVRSLLLRW